MAEGYPVPTGEAVIEIEVKRSRFIGYAAPAATVEAARGFIESVRQRHPDASHHVYAFEVGHGASVTHGMSDDGEPSGTAGRPALVVVENHELGDVVAVVVRYFGGTKLGTGGLVRAYTQAVSVHKLHSNSNTLAAFKESRFPVGSSAKTILGLFTRARARATLCC